MAYQARPNKPILPKRLAIVSSRGVSGYVRRRGMGQTAADSIAMAEQADYGTIPASTPVQVSAPGFNWAGTIGGLLNSWTQIASNVIAPRNTITTGPGGTAVNVAAGSPLPGGALLTPSLAGVTSSPLLWIVGGGVLIFLFAQMAKGR